MRLLLSVEADRNLDQITGWIARDNPSRAASFALELRSACEGLLEFPYRFPLAYVRGDTRKRTYGNYLIYYRVRGDILTILAIWHAARKQRRWP